MLSLAVIFGGRSAEHEVSLASARHLVDALDPARFDVVPVGITPGGAWVLPADLERALGDGLAGVACEPVALLPDPTRPGLVVGDGERRIDLDAAFPVLHGPYGEDGTIQAVVELAGLPCAGAGVAASAVGLDKEFMKAAFARAGLPQVDYVVARDRGDDAAGLAAEVEAAFAYPVFVKPANLGSSVGIVKAHDRAELETALGDAFGFDRKVIVEAFADARELECGVVGNEAPEVSVVAEVLPANEFYDYEAKYTDGMMSFVIPADVPAAVADQVRELAAAAFAAIDCAGYARCDFFFERTGGRVLVNEINTIPGMTAMSGFPKVWQASGVPFARLAERIVDLALARHAGKRRLKTSRL